MHIEEQSSSALLCMALTTRCAEASNKTEWLHVELSSIFCMTFSMATSRANSKNPICEPLGIHKGFLNVAKSKEDAGLSRIRYQS